MVEDDDRRGGCWKPTPASHADETGSIAQQKTAQLQVQTKDGAWQDAGPIHLLDDPTQLGGGNTRSGSNNTKTAASASNKNDEASSNSLRPQLPKHAKALLRQNVPAEILRRQVYLYRHASSNSNSNSNTPPNTNLMIFLHGAGGTHVSFDALAQKMALPQTASLSVHAAFHGVALPLDLGWTWFQELDHHGTGNPLPRNDSRRAESLHRAVAWLRRLLHYCTATWPPERIFLFGYGAGAVLAMETCFAVAAADAEEAAATPPFGGAVCVGGGLLPSSTKAGDGAQTTIHCGTATTTPVLLVVGERDESFSPAAAARAARVYDNSNVQIHVQPRKGRGMIESADEMRAVMEFLSRRLVRRQTFTP